MKINMMKLSKFVKWSVCGDGYVGYATHNKNAHYSIERLVKHTDYVKDVASKFTGLQDCKVLLKSFVRKDNGKEVISIRTTSHPLFTRIRDRQYINSRRVIEPHMLTLLDWEAAAYLYMDDGSLCYNNSGSIITRLSTCAYSYPEQEAIRKCFAEKLGIVWNINKNSNTWQLNLAKNSRDKWFDNIAEYILPSYAYKLPESL